MSASFMNKGSLVLMAILVTLLFSCKSKRSVITTPTGPVTMLGPKEARKAFEEKALPPAWVQIKADVEVNQNGSSNNGVAEIRMRQDSIVWVEIADPIIGFKAVRAFAMADTVSYINRLDKTYFAGSYNYVEQKLGTSIPFSYIFKVFQGQLFSANEKPEIAEAKYILKEEIAAQELFTAIVEPFNLDVNEQEYITATDNIRIVYSDYRLINGFRFPHNIQVYVKGTQQLTASFRVREIKTGGPLKTPFKISSKYERVR